MISELLLKFGSAPGVAAIPIPVTPVTVFVGPNNSGKSKVLAEIERLSSDGRHEQNDVILENLRFQELSVEEANAAIVSLADVPEPQEHVAPGHVLLASVRGGRTILPGDRLLKAIQNPPSDVAVFATWFLRHFILKLDGPNRIALVKSQPAGDLLKRPVNSLQALFVDEQKRKEVRRIIYEAFGAYFVIDPTQLGTLRIRLSPREPINDMEERNIHAAGVKFHSLAASIETTSDGVKAFTGIILELTAGDIRVLLIDEPEAFLHPSLANILGYEISRAAVQSNKRMFVSTHSPQFVMGCIQSGTPINIVRLTYRSGVATARVLPSNEILELMRNPLLRSTGVLNGLFFEHVVVTEFGC